MAGVRLALTLHLIFGSGWLVASEIPGPSSRRTSWSITEIMYHPVVRDDGRDLEFVELRNSGLIAEDLAGHRLAGEIEFQFPSGTVVPAGGRIIVARAPEDLVVVSGLGAGTVLGPFTGRLSNGGGTVRLLRPEGAILLEAEYRPGAPWPAGTDGAGLSLVLSQPSYGERDPRAWNRSARVGGSPGIEDPATAWERGDVRIGEFRVLPFTAGGSMVELVNRGSTPHDLSGLEVVVPALGYRRSVAPGTILAAGEATVLELSARDGVELAGVGEELLLLTPDGAECVDAIRLGPCLEGVTYRRDESVPSEWVPLQQRTPGTDHAEPEMADVIFNEIQYHPPPSDTQEHGEFVELFHRGAMELDLSGWQLVDGIQFTFPPGTRLKPGEYLVVARDPVWLRNLHSDLPSARVLGPYEGNLSNRGERLALERPVSRRIPGPAGSQVQTVVNVLEAEVVYSTGGEWGRWSDGGGSSLERVDARSRGYLGGDWQDSEESTKATWTAIEVTGRLELGVGTADQLQVFALGEGEYLVDDVRVTVGNGANRLANGTFDEGVTGWTFRGTQGESRWSSETAALRLVARGRGDSGANRVETPLTTPVPAGVTAVLSARIRWLRGDPSVLLRLRGNGLDAPVTLTLPTALGTPGRSNSRASSSAPPTIAEIGHFPVLPPAGVPCVITARVEDPDGVGSVVLRRRMDPSPIEVFQDMNDRGEDGDRVAGDGWYSATVPGAVAGTLHAFRIEARDASTAARIRTFPEAEALIRVGESVPVAGLGTYRIWMTQATRQRWSTRPPLDNAPLPVTFVYNDERVVHGVGGLYAGSPHISPGYSGPSSGLCGYVLHFPGPQPFLGATEVVLDWPGRDATAQQEPMAYWIARELGIPFNHRRYVRLHVNGVTETTRGSVFEDAQQVNKDLVDSWVPGASDGALYKIEQWFEFDDQLGLTHVGAPRLEAYRGTGGQLVPRRYRWNWLQRGTDAPHDYGALLDLVGAANASASDGYPGVLASLVDYEEWMRVFATENIVVNLDAWGYDIGKNMYAHFAPGGRWRLFIWDVDWVMLASAQHGYTPRSPLMYRGTAPFGEGNRDPVVGRMYRDPLLQRAYWRAIRDAVEGPLRPERVRARLTETHAALVRAGVTRSSGGTLAAPEPVRAWLASRRAYLVEQLATVASSFTVDTGTPATTTNAVLTLTGTAPIEAVQITVNGFPLAVTWEALTRWTARLPLVPGTNTLAVAASDATGAVISGGPVTLGVHYTGNTAIPVSSVVFNEWMAANASSVRDPADDDFEDWLELHNTGSAAVDLSGWWLTDTAAVPDQFVFPPGTRLEPGAFLLLWADGEPNQTQPGVSWHLPFRLDRGGELLTLRSARGDVVVETALGVGVTDRALGLWPDGSTGPVQELSQPTPGAANAAPRAENEPPRILSAQRRADDTLEVRWISRPGRRYLLQTTDTLTDPLWRDAGTEVTAVEVESTARIPLPLAAPSQRFVRVMLQP
ncbi:MAG: lamin tail domain-containing protein [Verrucomicrobiales bacterium]|nr:lamin tail domain-containing protein [Verrucomicrobiales bacterium]